MGAGDRPPHESVTGPHCRDLGCGLEAPRGHDKNGSALGLEKCLLIYIYGGRISNVWLCSKSKSDAVVERVWPRQRAVGLTSVRDRRQSVASDGDDELGVDVREAGELGLVEVHDEQLVGGRQLGRLVRELAIEVAHVLHRLLPQTQTSRYSTRSQRQHRCRPPANKIKNIDRLRASLSMPELKCDPRQK